MDVKGLMDFVSYARLENDAISKNVKRRYSEYNAEGIKLSNSANDQKTLKKALRCFEKALALASKNEYTKASACHELGVFYFSHSTHLPGGPYSNLNKAVSFFSRAIESKQRQIFPDKYASSLSQLGATYRRASKDI